MTGSDSTHPIWLLPLLLAAGFATAVALRSPAPAVAPPPAPLATPAAPATAPPAPPPPPPATTTPAAPDPATALRAEIDRLRQRILARERTVAALDRAAAAAAAPPPIERTWVNHRDWRAVGWERPQDALHSLLHAAASGDSAGLAALLALTPAAAEFAAGLHDLIPVDLRADFPTPDHLVAMMTVDAVPLGEAMIPVVNQRDEHHADVILQLRTDPAATPRFIHFTVQRDPGDRRWRILVPEDAIERYHARLLGPLPAHAPPPP